MPIYTYTLEQAEQWDKIVRSFESYDVYYLSGYAKAFYIHGDGQPLLFYYEAENIRGINVVMKRDISDDSYFMDKIQKNTFFDLITPYGYGGWLIVGNGDKKMLFKEYEAWCQGHGIVSEFVRYHPMLKNSELSNSFYDVVLLGNTVAIDLSSQDIIWENFTSKNRNVIRKAQKSGVRVYHGNYPEAYRRFKEVYNRTMDFDHATKYYYFSDDFYDSICNDLSEQSQVFWAELDGKIISVAIMISSNGKMNYHLSGFLREYQSIAPTNLLLYKAALWGCMNGYNTLHLGGGVGSKEDSLYKFKSAFNRKEVQQFAIGKKIYLDEIYKQLSLLKDIDENQMYFPIYRA